MTSNEARAAVLERALRAGLAGDRETLRTVLTEDVRAWTPRLSTSSLTELLEELERRDDSFSDLQLTVAPLDVGGDHACVEWTVEMTHTGRLHLADGTEVEASGTRVIVHGATVGEFLDDRICALRQYWDELTVLDQLPLQSRTED
jgi:ketosteroid isomerase-like protein